MHLDDLLLQRFPESPTKLGAFVAEATDSQKWLLEEVLNAHVRAEASGEIMPLVISTAAIKGGTQALSAILKEMGNREDIFDLRIDLQIVVRRYLSACGFKRANELLISNTGAEPLVLDNPESSPTDYHEIVRSLSSLSNELDRIYLAIAAPFDTQETCGGLIFCLCVRDGVLTLPELKSALSEIQAGRLARLGKLWYVYAPIGKEGQQSRRLFLGPLSVAFALRWMQNGDDQELTSDTINKALSRFAERLQENVTIRWRTFKGLQVFAQRFLRLRQFMPQHVVDYMSGELASTSISENCWTRLFGFEPDPRMLQHELEAKALRIRQVKKAKVLRPGFVQEICRSLSEKPQKKAHSQTVFMLEPVISGLVKQPGLLKQLAEFVDWMLRINGLKASTTKMHLEALSQVLFPMVSSLDQAVQDPEMWESIFENMLGDETRFSKSRDAVAKFADFLTRTQGDRFSSMGFSADALVNANIITVDEKNRTVSRIRLKLQAEDPKMTEVACHLVELAYGLGARRWELLGLHFKDVLGPLEPMIRFIKNNSRDLKTDASTRQLTLEHLKHEVFFESWQQFATCPADKNRDTNILEARGVDLKKIEAKIFAVIADALKEVTGLEDVSFHSLRHGAACRFLLSLYWKDLEHLKIEGSPYFDQIAAEHHIIERALRRKNTENFLEHKTVSAFLGHLNYRTTSAHYFHFYCLLRHSFMYRANRNSPLKDTPQAIVAITGVDFDLPRDEPIDTQLKYCAEHMQVPVIVIDKPCNAGSSLVLASDGESIRKTLVRITDLLLLPTEPARQKVLEELLPIASHRALFQGLLNKRADFLLALHEKVGLLKREGRGTGKKRDHGLELLRMPTNQATQSAIGAILAEVERLYTTRDQRRELAARLIDAMSFYSPRDLETFSFGPADDLARILGPVMTILERSKVNICFWERRKVRIPGQGPRDVNCEKRTVMSLSELPKITKGRLMVRIEAIDKNENYKPAVLAWVMGALYLAYGNSYLL